MLDNELKLPTPQLNNTSGGGGSSMNKNTMKNMEMSNNGDANGTNIDITANNTLTSLDSHSLERIQNFEEAFNKIKAATGIVGDIHIVLIGAKNAYVYIHFI